MDSGVVIRISAGGRVKRAHSAAGGSPVRMAMGGSWKPTPAARAGWGVTGAAGAFGGGGVAGADGDGGFVERDARGAGGLGDAGEGGAQVAFDIDGKRLDGRDVEDAAALVARRHGGEHGGG